MEETKVNITLPENWDPKNPIEIIHTERETIPQRDRKNYSITGVLGSIVEWFRKRTYNGTPQNNREIVLYSIHPDKPTITFMSDPTDPLGSEFTISTQLKPDADLAMYAINRDVYFSQKDLKALIRKTAHLFPNIDTAKDLLQRLDNFQARFETEVEKADDKRGNTKDVVVQAIKFTKGELPPSFELIAPIYANTKPALLHLDIEVKKEGNEPVFGFFCLELQKIKVEMAAELILGEVDQLRETFVTIEQ